MKILKLVINVKQMTDLSNNSLRYIICNLTMNIARVEMNHK